MKKPIRKRKIAPPPPQRLSIFEEYEETLRKDEGLRRIMFKSVLTNDEVVKLVELYCNKLMVVCGMYAHTSDEANDLKRFADRIVFLVKSMQ